MSRAAPMPRPALACALATALLLVAGCGPPPLHPGQIREPALAAIHARFREVVEHAHEHPELRWHSGWFGNIRVNSLGAEHQGLCYHWQEWVYDGVLDSVQATGWEATGVVINEETTHEHHAVLVYDPSDTWPERLLESPGETNGFVLDAWRRGRADIYRLADWLALPARIAVPARIEPLPYVSPEPEPEPASDSAPIRSTS